MRNLMFCKTHCVFVQLHIISIQSTTPLNAVKAATSGTGKALLTGNWIEGPVYFTIWSTSSTQHWLWESGH